MLSGRLKSRLPLSLLQKTVLPTFQHANGCSCCTRPLFANQRFHTSTTKLFQSKPRTHNGTFVSEHYQLNPGEVAEFLDRKNLTHRVTQKEFIVKDCPFCHDIKHDVTNQWKLYLSKQRGAYMCHRCGVKGSWYDFKNRLDNGTTSNSHIISYNDAKSERTDIVLPSQESIDEYEDNLVEEEYKQALDYLTETRGLDIQTLQFYGVGAANLDYSKTVKGVMSLTFPMYSYHNGKLQITRFKCRSVTNKSTMKLSPGQGGQMGFFGFHTVPADATEIILTEGEFDAMACYQETKIPTISVPIGCRSLPPELLPMLEKFTKIYLWMDDDSPGQQGAESFARKLGLNRCYIVHSNLNTASPSERVLKDANDVLLDGTIDMKELIEQAKLLQHDQILTYADVKDEIYRELYNSDERVQTGIQSTFFPTLINKVLKGHRRGEFTVVTGATGIGKTTVLSQLGLDFAQQGIPTLWGSFEIKNSTLMKKMLNQLAGFDLSQNQPQFEHYSNRFENLPQYFMSFYGSTNIDQVLDAMDYAVYVYDVQHIILDNLQFMLSGQATGSERFEFQDRALQKLRSFASSKNVHVTLVIHPRKVDENQSLGISSVFGTAKATQEADNVIIIQRGRNYRYISVKKNRFDGTCADVAYRYEQDSNRIIELTTEQVKEIEAGTLEIVY